MRLNVRRYFSGHSDALVGVLAVQKEEEYTKARGAACGPKVADIN
jgi:cystathionine beta-lyase/cystathionine gamma-synthase